MTLLCRCDRILWYGRGLSQVSYVRGESRFSDHRPVYSMFIAEVESINHSQIQKMSSWSSRLDIEELLPYSYGYTEIDHYGYTDLNFYWNGQRNSHVELDAWSEMPLVIAICDASYLPTVEDRVWYTWSFFYKFTGALHSLLMVLKSCYLENT